MRSRNAYGDEYEDEDEDEDGVNGYVEPCLFTAQYR